MAITIRTYSESTDQLHLHVHNLSEVKFQFLGDKEGPMKGFLS